LCAFVQIIEFILGLKSSALTTHWNHWLQSGDPVLRTNFWETRGTYLY
jgi:hypothetical protein